MKKFSQHEIHEIFSQISQSLNCVECKASILPHNIRITDMKESECLFDVNCNRCRCEMSLSAQIERNQNKAAMAYNRSSQIMHDTLVSENVNELDLIAIQNELKHFGGSFIRAFSG